MKKIDKRIIWIGSAVIIFLLVAGVALIWLKNSSRQIVTTPAVVPGLVNQTPTSTLPGNIWVVTGIEQSVIHQNGFNYDVATFTNLNQPAVTLRAQCSAPGWPSPEIGHQYTINEYLVMSPIEGIYSPLQRFWVLE